MKMLLHRNVPPASVKPPTELKALFYQNENIVKLKLIFFNLKNYQVKGKKANTDTSLDLGIRLYVEGDQAKGYTIVLDINGDFENSEEYFSIFNTANPTVKEKERLVVLGGSKITGLEICVSVEGEAASKP
jgi:hypothetical protein